MPNIGLPLRCKGEGISARSAGLIEGYWLRCDCCWFSLSTRFLLVVWKRAQLSSCQFIVALACRAGEDGRCFWKAYSAVAHPPGLSGGQSRHQSVVRNVVSHDGTCSDKGITSKCDPANNRCVRSNGRSLFHQGLLILVSANNVAPRIYHIRKNHRWATKDVIFEFHTRIDRNIVLDLHPVTDAAFGTYYDVLPKIATLAQGAPAHDVREVPDLCAFSDFTARVNHRCRVGEVRRLSRDYINRLPSLLHRPFTRFQNLQDLQPVLAVGAWSFAGSNAVKKVLAFRTQRLCAGQRNRNATVFVGNRCALDPVDSMRVQSKFLDGFRIVEYGHLPSANDCQLLLLERVQPAHKDVSGNPAAKLANRHCRVRNAAVKVSACLTGNSDWHLVKEEQNRGNIVRGETPQYVLFTPQFSEIQS